MIVHHDEQNNRRIQPGWMTRNRPEKRTEAITVYSGMIADRRYINGYVAPTGACRKHVILLAKPQSGT